ncbi:MAG: hypothetical protein EOL87_05025 [Spartobacteria bacterium]|nr:hypothetical protein [Spartobacteria bacterium]
MATGFLDRANSRQEKENLLRFACVAWNIACFKPNKSEQLLEQYIFTFKTANNATQEACDNLRDDMRELIKQKNILFPDVIKQIVDSRITELDGKEHIEISSIPFV